MLEQRPIGWGASAFGGTDCGGRLQPEPASGTAGAESGGEEYPAGEVAGRQLPGSICSNPDAGSEGGPDRHDPDDLEVPGRPVQHQPGLPVEQQEPCVWEVFLG